MSADDGPHADLADLGPPRKKEQQNPFGDEEKVAAPVLETSAAPQDLDLTAAAIVTVRKEKSPLPRPASDKPTAAADASGPSWLSLAAAASPAELFAAATFEVVVPDAQHQQHQQRSNGHDLADRDLTAAPRRATALFDETLAAYLVATLPNIDGLVAAAQAASAGALTADAVHPSAVRHAILEKFAASLEVVVQVTVGELPSASTAARAHPAAVAAAGAAAAAIGSGLPAVPVLTSANANRRWVHQASHPYSRRAPGSAPIMALDAGQVLLPLHLPIPFVDIPESSSDASAPLGLIVSVSQSALNVATTTTAVSDPASEGAPSAAHDAADEWMPLDGHDAFNLMAGLPDIDPSVGTADISIAKFATARSSTGGGTAVADAAPAPPPRRILHHKMRAANALEVHVGMAAHRARDDAAIVHVSVENVHPTGGAVEVRGCIVRCFASTVEGDAGAAAATARDDLGAVLKPLGSAFKRVLMFPGDVHDWAYVHSFGPPPSVPVPVVESSGGGGKRRDTATATAASVVALVPAGTVRTTLTILYSVPGLDDSNAKPMAARWECMLQNPLPLFYPLPTITAPVTSDAERSGETARRRPSHSGHRHLHHHHPSYRAKSPTRAPTVPPVPPIPGGGATNTPPARSLSRTRPAAIDTATANTVAPPPSSTSPGLLSRFTLRKRLSMTEEAIQAMQRTFTSVVSGTGSASASRNPSPTRPATVVGVEESVAAANHSGNSPVPPPRRSSEGMPAGRRGSLGGGGPNASSFGGRDLVASPVPHHVSVAAAAEFAAAGSGNGVLTRDASRDSLAMVTAILDGAHAARSLAAVHTGGGGLVATLSVAPVVAEGGDNRIRANPTVVRAHECFFLDLQLINRTGNLCEYAIHVPPPRSVVGESSTVAGAAASVPPPPRAGGNAGVPIKVTRLLSPSDFDAVERTLDADEPAILCLDHDLRM
ncbi:hypothetical protein BC828DRAFT_392405, partial [Blastocladiella britannica]